MDIDALRYFIALGKHGSFAKAAEQSFISRQGFGKAIGAIEAELGATLVRRDHSGAALTPQGEALLEHARKVVAGYDELVLGVLAAERDAAEQAVSEGDLEARPVCVVSTPYIMSSGHRFPRNQFILNARMEDASFSDILEMIPRADDNTIFSCVVMPKTLATLRQLGVEFVPFHVGNAGVILRKDSPLASKAGLSIADLRGTDIALYSGGAMDLILELIPGDKADLSVAMRTGSFRTLLDFAKAGRGAAFFDTYHLSGWMTHDDLGDDVCFVPFEGAQAYYFGILYARGRPLTPACRQYINLTKLLYR